VLGTAVAALLVLQPQAASAAWAGAGTGNAPAAAGFVQRAAAPTVTQVASAVRLDWAAVTLSEGTPATDYTLVRHAGATTTQVCTTVAPTLTCTDSSPVQGNVQYGVVARFQSWTGQESPLTPFTLDVLPPVTTLASNPAPNAAGWNKGAVTLTLAATDAAPVASLTYRIGASSPVTADGSSTSSGVSTQGSTAITYYATDTYGNVESTRSYTVKIDTTAPTTPTINNSISNDSGTPGDRVTNVAAQTLTGTAEAGSTVTISRAGATVASVVAAANGTYSAPVTLVEGANSLTAVATDQAGNVSAPSGALSVTLDTVLPVPTITDPKSGVTYKNGGPGAESWANTCAGTPGACGTASDSGSGVTSVTLVLRDTTANTCWSGTGTTYATCGSPLGVTGTTTWSKTMIFNVVKARSSLGLTITVTDLAGNVGTTTVSFGGQ
jgi:antitoxin (DNA-binding transcriptional repressor) of toxin-antitoxin stability system